jgi:hypothetical protein
MASALQEGLYRSLLRKHGVGWFRRGSYEQYETIREYTLTTMLGELRLEDPKRWGPGWAAVSLADRELLRSASSVAAVWQLVHGVVEGTMMGMYRKVNQPMAAAAGAVAAEDADWAKSYPAVLEFMTDQVGEGGEVVETATLLLFAEDGQWKACFTDRATERRLWRSGKTVKGTLAALEKALGQEGADWRPIGQPRQKASKKT